MARAVRSGTDEIARIIQRADIGEVAKALGIQIDARNRQPLRAICPFHDDSDPSLNLYKGGRSAGERDHYHCFVCGAHGDVVALIQNYERIPFWDAIQRLALIQGEELPKSRRAPVERRSGTAVVSDHLKAAPANAPAFAAFAAARGFDPLFLKQAGAGLIDLRSLADQARIDRAAEERLVAAGIFRRDEELPNSPDLYGTRLKGFFGGRRVVFEIADAKGGIAGFAARALEGDLPKYLFSYDFPRRNTLYGLDRILTAVRSERQNRSTDPIEIFLVEGIFDALRLEALGFKAAAILGSRLTTGQLDSLRIAIEAAREAGRDLRVHIMFDRDDAGRRGAYDAAISLLSLLDSVTPFELDVIWPVDPAEGKVDPDAWLDGLEKGEVNRLLVLSRVPALAFLAAFRLGEEPHRIDWGKPGRLKLAAEARAIALALPKLSWARILAPLDVGHPGDGLAEFAALVRGYGGEGAAPRTSSDALKKYRDPADDRADLLSALTLGRSSTSRREYPLEDDAWERLAVAASPLFHLHRARLEMGDGPSAPLLARELPKGGDRYRLKSGPVSEDALLHQYVLLELLRDRLDCQPFATMVPAVRYARERGPDNEIYRTGTTGERKALSFAYQIDMAIVNGETPPRREGIFRPYFECWRSFVDHLDDRIKRFEHEDLQILRLDITGFYDHVRRDVVEGALAPSLERALNLLPVPDDQIPSFAPLLRPDPGHNTAARAEAVTSFLLSHSFGLTYLDPRTGEPKITDPRHGIPQGPDLSAYLANISLFDLDDLMEAEIDRLESLNASSAQSGAPARCSIAYARYVDDIVLICRDLETAQQLRRKIEAWLSLKGLSLNRKNTTPAPMTRAEGRAWVTDNRAGFGFSGPLADLPTTEAMDPLADAGEIDRKTALGLLYDPELDDPANAETSLRKLALALSAPDIRFSDRANAYRRIWCLAASRPEATDGESLAAAFWSLLINAEPQSAVLLGSRKGFDIGLASFEGLDRALRSTVPTGMLADDACEQIKSNLLTLARCSLDDVFTPLAEHILGKSDSGALLHRYDFRCQAGIVVCLAAQKLTNACETVTFARLRALLSGTMADGTSAPLPEGLQLSLIKFDPASVPTAAARIVQGQSRTEAAFAKLNRTIVALQRVALHGETEEPIPHPVPAGDELNPITHLTNLIMRVWTPSIPEATAPASTDGVELDAAATLVNITYKNFAGVALRRPRLMNLIANAQDARPLPSPPGLETPGIMLWCGDEKLLLATAGGNAVEPIGAIWTDATVQAVPGIRLRVADLPAGYAPLYLSEIDWTPGRIATVYRAGFPAFSASLTATEGVIPVPTAFSFFVRVTDNVPDLTSIRLICWRAPRESVDNLAFIRNGASLEAKKVYLEGADYWRYGWAARDVCERAELRTDEEAGLDADAQVALHRKAHRREAIVARVLPRLSGSDRWGPGDVTSERPIPTRIERALSLLEHFDASNSAATDAAYLVAAMAEGMYMSERINTDVDLGAPGQPSALMVRSTRRLTRGLPEAAKLWQPPGVAALPYRRSAAAWQAISGKIADHIPQVAPDAVAPLANLRLGVEILAAVADLRALAFELSSVLSRDAVERLDQCEIEPSWLSDIVGLDVILVDEEGPNADPSLEGQARKLIQAFSQILMGRKGGLSVLRDRIAPTGWVVLVAILLQVAPLRQNLERHRPRLWPMDAGRIAEATAALRQLVAFLASAFDPTEATDEWPWDAFLRLGANKPHDLVALLRKLTDCASLNVSDEESWSNPRTGENQADRPVMRLADGSSQSLSDWQIDIAHVRGERGTATEAYSVGSRMKFRYSVTRRGDQVLGMHMVSRQLAQAVFGEAETRSAETATASEIVLPEPSIAAFSTEVEPTEAAAPRQSDTAEPAAAPARAAAPAPPERADSASLEADDAVQALRAIQRQSWVHRGREKNHAARRVAIVQWDVTETYSSPGDSNGSTGENGELEGLLAPAGHDVAPAEVVRKGGIFLSTTEFRRRAILKEVLSACLDFNVEGIVLPEYSLRPETVNWLTRQMRAMARPVTIWCGTFRVPSGTQIDRNYAVGVEVPFATAELATPPTGRSRWDYHAALLTCLRAIEGKNGKGIEVSHFVRQKRYPSAAVGELIRPPNIQWQPLLHEVAEPFDLGTFTLELICSEMFPHASSANFIGVIEENQELARRYGTTNQSETPFVYLSGDIYDFAKWTAYRTPVKVLGDPDDKLVRGKKLQRTLVVLPAMTARSADYHIFGQNQYLAAGLVTAFCNAVAPPYGCGQSAFIGLDGWKVTEGIRTPYGSKAPGIFQLGTKKHSGPLGKTEAAIIIADLDLLRTADQKPTPHYQTKALKLVAHLPMIFATEVGKSDDPGCYPNKQRRPRLRPVENHSMPFKEASSVVLKALQSDREWRSFGNIANPSHPASLTYTAAVDSVRDGLKLLERFVDDPVWMTKRTSSFTDERYTFPPALPLPALIDWVYVDDRWRPEPWMLAQPDEQEDSLSTDRPVLAVPKWMKDDPVRQPG